MSNAKKTVLEHLTRLNAGDIAGAASLMADDCVSHASLPEAQGRAGFERTMAKIRLAFPDLAYTTDDVLVDGDKVVLRLTFAGTNTGPITMIRVPNVATGKAVKFEQIHIMRVAGDKIVEHWLGQDSIAMFRQLGLQLSAPS